MNTQPKPTPFEKAENAANEDLKALEPLGSLPPHLLRKAGETEIGRIEAEADVMDALLQVPNMQSERVRDDLKAALGDQDENKS